MENEIELKIMLFAENCPIMAAWLAQSTVLKTAEKQLANTYYDTADHFFAHQKMGLRVRSQQHQYELTLKTAGDIVGGLHIRPEYNFPLATDEPDFKGLVSHFNLQFDPHLVLQPIFSTNFTRQQWLIAYQQSEIEVALDRGWIINSLGKESICELEFELKYGHLNDLIDFIDQLPKMDGMWLSSLSKAQRGYLVGNNKEIAKQIEKLTACNTQAHTPIVRYQWEQQLVDFMRLTQDTALLNKYAQITPNRTFNTIDDFYREAYFRQTFTQLRTLFSD